MKKVLVLSVLVLMLVGAVGFAGPPEDAGPPDHSDAPESADPSNIAFSPEKIDDEVLQLLDIYNPEIEIKELKSSISQKNNGTYKLEKGIGKLKQEYDIDKDKLKDLNKDLKKLNDTIRNIERGNYEKEDYRDITKEYDVGEEIPINDFYILKKFDNNMINIFNKRKDEMSIQSWRGNSEWDVYGSNTNDYGDQVNLNGTIKLNLGTINHSVEAKDLTASAGIGTWNYDKTRVRVDIDAYGIIGSGGIGRVYSGNMSTNWIDGDIAVLDSEDHYSALKVYTTIAAYADLQTEEGRTVTCSIEETRDVD